MRDWRKRKHDADRFRGHYDPDPLTERYDPQPDYDPDPFIISVPTLIAFVVMGGVISGISLSLQRPQFFDHLLMMIDPALKEVAKEELEASREFWRMIFVIVLIIACVILIVMWWRYSQRKAESEKRWKRINSQRSAFL